MTRQRKGGRRENEKGEERGRDAESGGAAREDPREDEGWSQPESSAQKQPEGSPPERIPEEG